jgi:hypothetical protein
LEQDYLNSVFKTISEKANMSLKRVADFAVTIFKLILVNPKVKKVKQGFFFKALNLNPSTTKKRKEKKEEK